METSSNKFLKNIYLVCLLFFIFPHYFFFFSLSLSSRTPTEYSVLVSVGRRFHSVRALVADMSHARALAYLFFYVLRFV